MKYLIGNWKMNKSLAEAVSFVQAAAEPVSAIRNVEATICPPLPWIPVLDGLLRNSRLHLGAQDVSAWKSGAYTGQVSATMLANHCQYVIIGHSERRHYCAETNDQVNDKVLQAIEAKLIPVVCVSNLQEIQALAKIKTKAKHWLIAYEPLEAIGSGQATDPAQVKSMVATIRQHLGRSTLVLYGGSVTADNIASYAKVCDGALVGGASLDPQSFISLCQALSN